MKKTLLFLSASLFLSTSIMAQDCNCMLSLDETFSVVPMNSGTAPDYRNDDGFSSAIELPFTFNLYGTEHDSCYINNNGNISFGNGYSTFVANGFPINNFPMISAYWADVDTRNLESGLVYYKMTDHALIVRYNAVGYFPNMADQLNDFQIIISDGQSELIPNGHSISFCYGDMQWSTGTAATVGANAGDGVNALQIGRFNETSEIYDGPYGESDDVDFIDDSNITFSTNTLGENQYPINVSNLCDTIFGGAGDTLVFYFYDDIDQDLDFDVTDSSGYFEENDSLSGMVLMNGILTPIRFSGDRDLNNYSVGVVIAENTPDGVYPLYITATDNGAPSLSSTSHYEIVIGNGNATSINENLLSPITVYIQNGYLMFNGLEDKTVEMFTLYNSNGQNILQTNKLYHGINMSQMATGVYLYSVKTNQGTFTGRFAK